MSFLSKFKHNFFFQNCILKFIQNFRGLQISEIILKKGKFWRLTLPDYKLQKNDNN